MIRRSAAVVIFATLSAQAGVIIGNLPAANDLSGTGFLEIQSKAMGFTMGESSANLDSATFRYEIFDLENLFALSFAIYGDQGGVPGTWLAELTGLLPLGPGVFELSYTPVIPVTLAANTTYWLVMQGVVVDVAGPLPVRWLADSPAVTPTGPLATHFGSFFSTGASGWVSSDILNSYEINAVPVPESSTLWLTTGGLGLLAWRRRRAS